MERIPIDEEFLYNLMPRLDEKLISAMQVNVDYHFTDGFETKMATLIKRNRQKRKYGIPVTTSRRVAAILVIVLIGMFTLSMSVEAVREKVLDFIETKHDTHIEKIYFMNEKESEEFLPLWPTYIPEGYKLVAEELLEDYHFMVYEFEEGNIIVCQEQIVDGMVVSQDNEYVKEKEINIQGVSAQIKYKENGIIRILWEKQNCMFTVSGENIDEEELIKICKSL